MLRRLALMAPLALCLLGCPPRVKPGQTPILQPVPPPGTPTSRPAAAPAGGHGHAHGEDCDHGPAVEGLPPTGHNSAQQLQAEAAAIDDPELRAAFQQAYVLTFHMDKARRDGERARALVAPLLERDFAPAWRIHGYTYIDQGFQLEPALRSYRRAVQADDTYGMAHYALAFTLTQVDPAEGRKHFQRAMELKVEDQRNLRQRFYP